MNRTTSWIIAGISTAIGSFVAMPAHASTLVDNSRPSTCELLKNGELQKTCNAFRLIRARDESIGFDGFKVEFLFDDVRVTYIAVINGNAVTKETANGKPLTFYPTMVLTLEPQGGASETSTVDGVCGISPDYSQVICQDSDSTYFYRGEPRPAQQNTGTPEAVPSRQTSSANRNQYAFNTNSHVNTDITVNTGDTITIQASGTIRFGFFAGSGDPRGILFNPAYNYFIGLPHGQLMARVRQFGMQDLDGWFPVGEGTEIVARSSGILKFAVNDNNPGDNAGSFRIEVAVDPAP